MPWTRVSKEVASPADQSSLCPAPGLFAWSIANLTDIPPTIYFKVPAGYAQLVPALEADREFSARFFSRLRLMFNAAAALPGAIRDRLTEVAIRTAAQPVPVTGSWGATETAPAVTTAHFDYADARCIGVPLPGTQVKLVPAESAYEIRVKGPMVTPGYFARPDLTAAAFDDQGFYQAGDAVTLADPLVMARPADLDAGEITDKGYVNQRRVLANRAGLVELLYAQPVPPGVVVAKG
jgi:feruloyl-CoA synthase